MRKKENKIKVTEIFKNEPIDKRQEILEKLFYNIIKIKESNYNEVRPKSDELFTPPDS